MYKTALAAISLAMSFGLGNAVSAQDTNQNSQQGQGQSSSTGDSNSNSGTGNSSNSGSGNNTSGTGSGSSSPKAATTAKPAAAPAAPAPVYVQTYGTSSKSTGSKTSSTTTTTTSTGEQKSTSSTTTKTASITPKAGSTSASTTTTTTAASAASKRTKDDVVVLQESGAKKYVATKNKQWQTFDNYIQLKPGQEGMPLTMTVTNENYTGINMLLNGQKLATDKDFKGATLRMQMTGALAGGDNKLTIQAFGPVGSNLTWKLTTLKPVITTIKPVSGAADDEITLTGKNFAKIASGNFVFVGQKAGTIKAGTSTSGKEIVFTIPKEVLSGKTTITVSVGGILSKPADFIIKAAPEVTGVDLLSAPPGQTMTITGKGFSTTQTENVVTVGGVPATISSCSATSITVTVPEMFYPQWHLPIVVKTGNVESKGDVKINVQMRVIPNDGVPEQ